MTPTIHVVLDTPVSLLRPGNPRAATTRWAIYGVVLMASAQIALPLSGGAAPLLTTITVFALSATTFLFACNSWPARRVGMVFGLLFCASLLVEAIGVRTGFPFGAYEYTNRLQPQIFGIPVIIGLAWFAMALPAWELARRITSSAPLQCFLGGVGLVIWDLFLDPQMTENRFWAFEAGGWQGIPLSNGVGWLLTGTTLMTIPVLLLRPSPSNNGLAFLYCWMIGLATLGFLLPFAFDRPEVALVGFAAALPFFYFAFRSRPRPWLTSQS